MLSRGVGNTCNTERDGILLSIQAGIIEEMLEDTFESMDDQEEMEEAAEMEIDRILFEITAGMGLPPIGSQHWLLHLSSIGCAVRDVQFSRNRGFLVSDFHNSRKQFLGI